MEDVRVRLASLELELSKRPRIDVVIPDIAYGVRGRAGTHGCTPPRLTCAFVSRPIWTCPDLTNV